MLRLDASWDASNPTPVRRSIIITSSPRSGSNLLCRMLWDTGLGGRPDEYFDTVRVRELSARWGVAGGADNPLGYLDALTKFRVGDNGVFALKLHWHQFEPLLAAGIDLAAVLPNPVFVRTTRDDTVRQAMSYHRGLTTGEFSSEREPQPDPPFNFLAITDAMRRINTWERNWDAYYTGRDDDPLHIVYEDFAADIPTVTRDVLRNTLGELLDADTAIDVPEPSLKKQDKPMYQTWNAMFADRLDQIADEAMAGL